MDYDNHIHLYGMINNNHISLLTNPETKADIARGFVQPKQINYDCEFEYVMCVPDLVANAQVEQVYQALVDQAPNQLLYRKHGPDHIDTIVCLYYHRPQAAD